MTCSSTHEWEATIRNATDSRELFGYLDQLMQDLEALAGCPITLHAQKLGLPTPLLWTSPHIEETSSESLIIRMERGATGLCLTGLRANPKDSVVPALVLHDSVNVSLRDEFTEHLEDIGDRLKLILNHPDFVLPDTQDDAPATEDSTVELISCFLRLQNIVSTLAKPQETLDALTKEVTKYFSCDAGAILLFDVDGLLEFSGVHRGGTQVRTRKIAPGRGVAGWAAQHGVPVICNNTSLDERFNPAFSRSVNYEVRALMVAPLIVGHHCIGVIEVLNPVKSKHRSPFYTFLELDVLSVIANHLSHSIDRLRNANSHREHQRLRAVGQSAASMAQDLRGPLQAIHGVGQVLASGRVPADELFQMGEMVQTVTASLAEMTEAVLGFAQDSGGPTLGPVAIQELLEPFESEWEELPQGKNAVLVLKASRERGQTDSARVRRIIQNLMGHAIRATRLATTVTCEVLVKGEKLEIAVNHQGAGIPKNSFEPRRTGPHPQIESSRPDSGRLTLGIGMAIVQQDVLELEGSIRVAESSQWGSRIIVELPFNRVLEAM